MSSATRRVDLTRPILTLLTVGMAACSDQNPTEPSVDPSQNVSATAAYTLHLLGGNGSEAADLNSAGVVVGTSNGRAVRWKNGVMTDLGTLGTGTFSAAIAINPHGVIVGSSQTTAGNVRAFRWTNGVMRNLGTLGGRNSQANDINALGVIVGWSETATGHRHAFIWKNGKMNDLGTLPGHTSSVATAITRSGVVVGISSPGGPDRDRAVRWKDGVIQDLGTFGGEYSVAVGISNAGRVVGGFGTHDASEAEELHYDAFVWYRGVKTNLGSGIAVDINPDRVIVGEHIQVRSRDSGQPEGFAWVWENGVTTILPGLSSQRSSVESASAISPKGHVVGFVSTGCDLEPDDSWTCGPRRAALWRRN